MPRSSTSPERLALVAAVRQRAGKMNMYQICHETGLTPGQVTWIAQQNKLSLAFSQRNPQAKAHQEETVIRMHGQQCTAPEIAAALGVTKKHVHAIIGDLRRRGVDLPARPKGGYRRGYAWSPQDVSTLKRLYLGGATAKEIVEGIARGASQAAVHSKIQALRDAGELPEPDSKRKSIWTPERIDLLKRLWGTKMPLDQIVKQVQPGMTPESLRARVSDLRAEGVDIPHRSRKPHNRNKNM